MFRFDLIIVKMEAMNGDKRAVALRTPVSCEECSGTGAKRRHGATCRGQGQVSTSRGVVMFSRTCPERSSEGSVVKTPCASGKARVRWRSSERGWSRSPRASTAADGGQSLRVRGQGMPGQQGGPMGDLYVDVDLAPHER